MKALSYLFYICALLFFGTAYYMAQTTDTTISRDITGRNNDFMFGPFDAETHGRTYSVAIDQDIPVDGVVIVAAEVIDTNQNSLYSFGDELWQESGVEEGESWREDNTHMFTKITLPHRGEYYLTFSRDKSAMPPNTSLSPMHVTINSVRGSAMPHLWWGVIILGLGLIFGFIAKRLEA